MRRTIRGIKAMKRKGQKIAMVTAYDATSAAIIERAGIPVVLVGDSLGNVMLGHGDTLPVTMDDMVHHVKAVVRGTEKTHVVADLPFMSYQASVEDAVRNSGRMLQEGGAQSVKLEGGERLAGTVERIVGGRHSGHGAHRIHPPVSEPDRGLPRAGQDVQDGRGVGRRRAFSAGCRRVCDCAGASGRPRGQDDNGAALHPNHRHRRRRPLRWDRCRYCTTYWGCCRNPASTPAATRRSGMQWRRQ